MGHSYNWKSEIRSWNLLELRSWTQIMQPDQSTNLNSDHASIGTYNSIMQLVSSCDLSWNMYQYEALNGTFSHQSKHGIWNLKWKMENGIFWKWRLNWIIRGYILYILTARVEKQGAGDKAYNAIMRHSL